MSLKFVFKKLIENNLLYNVRKGLNRVFETAIIYYYDLRKFNFEGLELPSGYTFQYVDQLNIDLVKSYCTKYRHSEYFEETVIPRLRDNNVVGISAIYNNSEIAMMGWILLDPPKSKHILRYPYSKSTFYPMDGFVSPEHRGKRLHKYSIDVRFKVAKEKGKEKGYGSVYSFNKPAISDNDKYGKRVGIVLIIKYPFKFSINIYKIKNINLYFNKHRSIK